MHLRSAVSTLPALALAAIAAYGCEDSAVDPAIAEVAGSYEATTLIGHDASGDIDVLAAGGSLTLTLAADGTTTGTLFVPGGDEDGSDFTADLAGTWQRQGDTVSFEHEADTFIRDVTFTYEDGRLVSSSVFADVVLTRQ